MKHRCSPALVKFAARAFIFPAKVAAMSFLLGLGAPPPLALAKDEPKWIEVHSPHFSVVTDAGEKRGREAAARMEQMRSVFGQLILKDKLKMSVPVTVIALKSDTQYGSVAPAKAE